MRIAISGAGITGTTVGFMLSEQGHDVTLFEQAKEFHPVGAGIMLQSSGQQVLSQLGIMDDLATVSEKLNGMTAVQRSGRLLAKLAFAKLGDEFFAYGVHRGQLFQRLLDRCRTSGVDIRNGIQIDSFDADSRAVMSTDGVLYDEFDFVIAADGSRSRLRQNSSLRCRTIEYNHAAIWTTGACEFQPGELYQVVDGTQKLLGLLPIGEGKTSFFWGLRAGDWEQLRTSNLDVWKAEVGRFCPQSQPILDQIHSFSEMQFGMYRNVALSTWFGEKIIFLGDAAHATSPHLGQGVNLALEDAFCFAEAIRNAGSFERACDSFTKIRTAKLRYYQQLTRFLSPFFQSDMFLLGLGRDVCLPWLPNLPFVGKEMLRTLCGQKQGWFG